MVKKRFWHEPRRTELETQVRSVDGNRITLDETIFYAFSGGQESDAGTIGGHRVLEARKEEQEILYTLEEGHALQTGDRVAVKIDGARRDKLMRLHFAAELVLELVTRTLPSVPKVGAHIAEDKAHIDFECSENISRVLPEIGERARAIIEANQPIISAFTDEANERRYWEVPGFARVPCGGTHLHSTGEVGSIELKRKNPGKGKERIEIRLQSDGCARQKKKGDELMDGPKLFGGFDHVAYATRDTDGTVRVLGELGFEVKIYKEELKKFNVYVTKLVSTENPRDVAEVVEPLEGNSVVSRLLADKEAAVYHTCFRTRDFYKAQAALKRAGAVTISRAMEIPYPVTEEHKTFLASHMYHPQLGLFEITGPVLSGEEP